MAPEGHAVPEPFSLGLNGVVSEFDPLTVSRF